MTAPKEHRSKAVDALASSRVRTGGRIAVLQSLSGKKRWSYFVDHFLILIIAIITICCLLIWLIMHILNPAPGPKLYVALVDHPIESAEADEMSSQAAMTLHMKADDNSGLVVDDGFDFSRDGLPKLQTMLSAGTVDVIIAPKSTFARLASYGYMSDLSQIFPDKQFGKQALLPGPTDDGQDDDAEASMNKGPVKPYGLMCDSIQNQLWQPHQKKKAKSSDLQRPDSASSDQAVIGLAVNSPHMHDAARFAKFACGR